MCEAQRINGRTFLGSIPADHTVETAVYLAALQQTITACYNCMFLFAVLDAISLSALPVAGAAKPAPTKSLSSWPPRTSCRRRAVLLSLLPALSLRQTHQRSWTILWRRSRFRRIGQPIAATSGCTSRKSDRKCMVRCLSLHLPSGVDNSATLSVRLPRYKK